MKWWVNVLLVLAVVCAILLAMAVSAKLNPKPGDHK